MPAKRKNIRKTTNQKKTNPSLNLVLKRLDKFDQRFDTLDQKIDAVDRKVDAVDQKVDVFKQETAAEFKAMRQETATEFKAMRQETATEFKAMRQETAAEFQAMRQETAAAFQAIRQETAQGFDSLRQEFKNDMAQSFAAFHLELKAEMQKEFEKHGAGIHQHFSRVENELKAENAELRDNQRKLLTSFDASARDYEEYRRDRVLSDGMLYNLRNDVDELKKRDMEKAAAIDKIEKEIEKSKAA